MEQLSIDLDKIQTQDEISISSEVSSGRDDLFGCCSHYRECSAAGKCIAETEGSESCIYRKNLEKGIIFYGKNANNFDIVKYNSLLEKYNSLNYDIKRELDCAILYFIKYRTSVLWYSSNEITKLQELGFLNLHVSASKILDLCSSNVLNRFMDADTKKTLNSICQERSGNERAKAKKPDIIEWLVNNPTSEVNEYINKFVYISFPDSIKKYIFEIYYDFLKEKSDTYTDDIIKRLPLKNETNFIGVKGK